MLFLKRLRLKNYCNFSDHTFDFTRKNGSPYPFVCFYGPNGIGKSSCLEAISKLTMNTAGRSRGHVLKSLQKYIRNVDYDPQYESVKSESLSNMLIEGTYDIDGKDYTVQLTQDGYIRNDLAPIPTNELDPDLDPDLDQKIIETGPWGKDHLTFRQRVAHFITSDSDLSLNKIQVHKSQIDNFETLISQVMRYKAECITPSGFSKYDKDYATDVVIHKGDYKIHFKRMSAGERKICKSFSQILNLMHDLEFPAPGEMAMPGWPRVLLVDNIVMHVYYDRHVAMVECLKDVFQHQQIFATTHSGMLIQRQMNHENDSENELFIDLERVNPI